MRLDHGPSQISQRLKRHLREGKMECDLDKNLILDLAVSKSLNVGNSSPLKERKNNSKEAFDEKMLKTVFFSCYKGKFEIRHNCPMLSFFVLKNFQIFLVARRKIYSLVFSTFRENVFQN